MASLTMTRRTFAKVAAATAAAAGLGAGATGTALAETDAGPRRATRSSASVPPAAAAARWNAVCG